MSGIVVIDDSGDSISICQDVLERLGHHVEFFSSGEAINAFSAITPLNLVIVNVLPGIHEGIEFFAQIKKNNPVVEGLLLLEEGDFDAAVKGLNAGLSKVYTKPVPCEELQRAVNEILNSVERSREATRKSAYLPLYKLGQKLLHVLSEDEIFDELAEIIKLEFGAPTVSVMMMDEDKGRLKIVAHRGLEQKFVENIGIEPGTRIAGKVFQSDVPVILNRDSQGETEFKDFLVRPELSAAISFPIKLKQKVVGVINVSETESDCRFNESDLEMLSIISDQAMMALGKIRSLKAREEQQRIRTLLEQYVSPEVSKMLVQSRRDLMDVGNVQELTVLFADIRSFTLLVQKISARQLRSFLNVFFDLLASVVFNHKGMLDKFMGDAALAVFGAPVDLDNHTQTAVSVARELDDRFKELQESWEEINPVFKKISLGIGISRGPLFLGNIGSEKRVDYTVIGTEVNVAQRLASELDHGQILLTKEAYDALDPSVDIEKLGPMYLRGMTSEVGVYRLKM